MKHPARLWFVTLLLLAPAACHRKPGLDAASLTKAIEAYLVQRGDVCIARQEWPVDLTENDRAARTRDAVQMPVLERLGVVEGHRITLRATNDDGQTVVVPVTRYELTERGQQSYIDRHTRRPVAPNVHRGVQADLCVGRVSLGKVASWEAAPPSSERQPSSVAVSYTYKIDVVPWMRDPEALRVFPAIARLIAGAGTAELREGLVLTPEGWVANELAAPAPAPASTVASHQEARP
jgi:hypothetical protein